MRRHSLDLAEPCSPVPSDTSMMDDNVQQHDKIEHDDIHREDVDLTLPPSDDDIAIWDHDSAAIMYTPPPRIAARFYRPSQARRKGSAASSRRNSMSSAHSRCSSSLQQQQSGAGGDQSKHVAQHLRRASFLEDRRARLADRAAHAEKVRLRAAVAKAATRDASVSHDRAVAAQLARERNLAEIVASCAEEVKKAKLVAESVREKREQGIAKMRLQMEERMAEAERRRRDELRRRNNSSNRPRGHSHSTSNGQNTATSSPGRKSPSPSPGAEASAQVQDDEDEGKEEARPPMTPEAAASRIADWWLACSRKKAMRDFNNLGLSVDGIRDTSFDTVTELLAQEKVLVATARLLRTCGLQEGAPGSVGEMSAVLANKTDEDSGGGEVLSMAHRLPAADLDNPQLQDLVGKAKDLLITFENILARLTWANRYTVPPAICKTLPEAYAVFHNAFIAWKSRDSNALIEVMLMQFVELDAIFQTVRDSTDDAASALYRQSIQDSQLMLIVRIKKLAGQDKGKKMIFDAVSEARRSRRTKKRTGDTKPRVAETTPSEASAAASNHGTGGSGSSNGPLLTPPATPASGSRQPQPQPQQPQQQQRKPVTVRSGFNGLLPDNRIVVHELALNKEYQIPAEEYQELQAAMSRPLFERMRANMGSSTDKTHNDFRLFMAMAGDIKDKLQRLLKPGNSMYKLIDEMLDPEMAERQFLLGSFSYEKFFTAMASMLPKLCAPFRDEEVADLIRNRLLPALSGFIDVMLGDYVNYLLRVAAPGLIESAPQYEAKRFADDFESGRVGLAAAEAAWRAARSKVLAEAARRDPEAVNHPKSRPTASRIYAQMLVDVFTTPLIGGDGGGGGGGDDGALAAVPEMLRLDASRITHVSTSLRRIVTAGAVLLQCKNLLKRDVRSPWKMEAARVMAVLEEASPRPGRSSSSSPPPPSGSSSPSSGWTLEATVDGTMSALEAGRSMPAATKGHLRALVTKVLSASNEWSASASASSSAEPREPVLRLLHARLRGNILSRLAPASSSASEKVKAANTAGERLASLGLSEFVERVRQMSDLLDRVGTVDRAAHGPWWDAIATKVDQE
ncbi:T-complex protein 11 [Geosmithia morbida]|uniref:T-complex protein 11 n=1 Tax=Geosmithia morbida TaxID=1094350 RepID=A0A9P4YP51_9HYPO|nr:T-complex protein 11 [Geosmithia morbida]KAF4119229.1 T-complex protein 11 [Geosmithia morbida]